MCIARVIIVQIGFTVVSVCGFEASASTEFDMSVAGPAPRATLPETSKPQVKIAALHVDSIQLLQAYRLDVNYKIEIEKWNPDDRFNIKMHLTEKDTPPEQPMKGRDGKKLEWCFQLDRPEKKRGDTVKWDSTLRVRIAIPEQLGDNVDDLKSKRLKLYMIVTDTSAEAVPVSDPRIKRLHFKKLDSDHKPQEIKDIGRRRGLVVILPGITGKNRDLEKIEKRIAKPKRDQADPGLAVQIWDWTELAEIDSLALRDRARVSSETKAAAKLFAHEIKEWRRKDKHVDKKLYLLCGSGGASIALLAADHLPAEEIFERVVFASAAVNTERSLVQLTKQIRNGSLYNYYSHNDYILVGIISNFLFTLKFELPWPAAGRFGYRDSAKPPSSLRQLGWNVFDKLDNRGGHLRCYKPDYFEKFFLPLFCDNGNPDRAKEKKYCRDLEIHHSWQHEVVESYEQVEPEQLECE